MCMCQLPNRCTCAIAAYSTTTDVALSPKTTQTACLVESASIREIATGANSLQARSMRLIDAFRSASTKVGQQQVSLQTRRLEHNLLTLSAHIETLGDDNGLLHAVSHCQEIHYTHTKSRPAYPVSLNCHRVCRRRKLLHPCQDYHDSEQDKDCRLRPVGGRQHGDEARARRRHGDALPNCRNRPPVSPGSQIGVMYVLPLQKAARRQLLWLVHLPIDCRTVTSLSVRSTTVPSHEDSVAIDRARASA